MLAGGRARARSGASGSDRVRKQARRHRFSEFRLFPAVGRAGYLRRPVCSLELQTRKERLEKTPTEPGSSVRTRFADQTLARALWSAPREDWKALGSDRRVPDEHVANSEPGPVSAGPGAIVRGRGDMETARESYEALRRFLKDADPGVPFLKEVRNFEAATDAADN